MRILGTGLTGLVGSRITELLKDTFEFENISLDTGVNITEKDSVLRAITSSTASIVVHLAAKADVDGCEKDKLLGKEGDAWKINVKGTQHVVDACRLGGKQIIYISTDFVFDGEKEEYSEEDAPSPINWYAQTKYEGEKIVQGSDTPWLIIRIAYPYRSSFERKDFVRAVASRLKNGQEVTMVKDHIMTPTFIDDIAKALHLLIEKNATGIFHVVGSQWVSPYDGALLIAKTYGFDTGLVQETTRAQYFTNRAPRPFRLALKNDKLRRLGVPMLPFSEGLASIKDSIVL
ncbi:MAG: SDR family oxidoreductase [Candidatus Levybacteria bacterium]|nr:SDR family oxidoreductase [Candidatus Levybacteria bacterium]